MIAGIPSARFRDKVPLQLKGDSIMMKYFVSVVFSFLLLTAVPLTALAGGSKCHDCGGYSPIGHTDNRGGDGGKGGDGGHGYGGKGGDARADQHQGQSQKQGQDQSQVANGGQGGSTGPVTNGGNNVTVNGDKVRSYGLGLSGFGVPDAVAGSVTVIDTDCIPKAAPNGKLQVHEAAGMTWVLGTKPLAVAGAIADSSGWKLGGGVLPIFGEAGHGKAHSEPTVVVLDGERRIECVAAMIKPQAEAAAAAKAEGEIITRTQGVEKVWVPCPPEGCKAPKEGYYKMVPGPVKETREPIGPVEASASARTQ